jgi:MFS family permease
LGTCAVAGIALGSVFGGDFVKTGRRTTIIYFNFIGLLSTLISFLPNFILTCIGRTLFGFTCGVLICATPKAIDETIPSKVIDKGFGASTNIVINLAFMMIMVLALGMPEDEMGLTNNSYWMVIFGI